MLFEFQWKRLAARVEAAMLSTEGFTVLFPGVNGVPKNVSSPTHYNVFLDKLSSYFASRIEPKILAWSNGPREISAIVIGFNIIPVYRHYAKSLFTTAYNMGELRKPGRLADLEHGLDKMHKEMCADTGVNLPDWRTFIEEYEDAKTQVAAVH